MSTTEVAPGQALQTVELSTGAWFGDRRLTLSFPPHWDVRVMGTSPGPALSPAQLRERLHAPIGTPRLAELARGRRSAVIIVDDTSRPTPAAELLPLVLQELEAGGLPPSAIRIVIAAGGHEEFSAEDNLKKVGSVADRVSFEVHDPDGDLIHAGTSPSGIPLHINQTVMSADLKIGIGGIGPHDAAGFSGGSKILVPGVAGTQTARYLHDFMRGAGKRGEGVDNDFRRELDAITGALGLNFIVNVVLNHERQIAGLFAGDRVLAHREGAGVAATLFAVPPVPEDAEIVIANTYPFDANLWYVRWGFWPLAGAPEGATRVALIDGSQGAGSHRLKPTELSLLRRAWLRLLTLRPRHVTKQLRHLFVSFRRSRKGKQMEFLMLCPHIADEVIAERFPHAKRFRQWDALLERLRAERGEGRVKVAVYPCAPLQIPAASDGVR
jgi:hypothetical protein